MTTATTAAPKMGPTASDLRTAARTLELLLDAKHPDAWIVHQHMYPEHGIIPVDDYAVAQRVINSLRGDATLNETPGKAPRLVGMPAVARFYETAGLMLDRAASWNAAGTKYERHTAVAQLRAAAVIWYRGGYGAYITANQKADNLAWELTNGFGASTDNTTE